MLVLIFLTGFSDNMSKPVADCSSRAPGHFLMARVLFLSAVSSQHLGEKVAIGNELAFHFRIHNAGKNSVTATVPGLSVPKKYVELPSLG